MGVDRNGYARLVVAALTIVLPSILLSIPIPNGQVGRAEVDCAQDTIDVVFITQEVFQGRVFVVGHANDSKCVSREVGKRITSITIHRSQCGVVTTRSSDPPGLFVTTRVMLSFHPGEFITKVDRAYEISCFYMSKSQKSVSSFPIAVAPATLQPITETAETPKCRYEVLDGGGRKPANTVPVGAKLLHRWACDSSSPELWCMTVHSCFVESESGSQLAILDDNGCAIDRLLLGDLDYSHSGLQAQKEARAFKFGDRVSVNFICSIRLNAREGECPLPHCPTLTDNKSHTRAKRESIFPGAMKDNPCQDHTCAHQKFQKHAASEQIRKT